MGKGSRSPLRRWIERIRIRLLLRPAPFSTGNNKARIVQEEIFRPVPLLLRFKSYQEVIEKANDVLYGFASSFWTRDLRMAIMSARELRFRTVWVNDHAPIPSEMSWNQ